MTPLYGAHLWVNYSVADFQSVKTAYNCIFRKLFNVSRFESASFDLAERKLPTVKEIISRATSSHFRRCNNGNVFCSDVLHPITAVTFKTVLWSTLMVE